MAVFQISRIQVRRGQEGTGTGVPQLTSGEFGWAIDTQNLYIGNGTIEEGAPFTGNTKILTENDSLLDNILLYQYKKNDASISTGPIPVARPLQDRLDDHVSAKSFGNDLQLAINELFLPESSGAELDTNKRVILEIPAGVYHLSDVLKIPAYTTLQGAGQDKTIIIQDSATSIFETVPADISISPLFTNQNRPTGVIMKGITFVASVPNTTLGILHSAADSILEDLTFQGVWNPLLMSGSDFVDSSSIGLKFLATSSLLNCQNNRIKNCKFVNLNTAVVDDSDSRYNIFDSNYIDKCYKGIIFGGNTDLSTPGMLIGPTYNVISKNTFHEVYTNGIKIKTGQWNSSQLNKFIKTGTDGADENHAKYSPIEFISQNNVSVNDNFDRVQYASIAGSATSTLPYISEVNGQAIYDTKYTSTLLVDAAEYTESAILRFSAANNAFHKIHYSYVSSQNQYIRQGVLDITINAQNITDGFGNLAVTVADEYNSQGDTLLDNNITFIALAEDLDLDSIKETITLKIKNDSGVERGKFIYWYETICTPSI